jgi:hypothetical protein
LSFEDGDLVPQLLRGPFELLNPVLLGMDSREQGIDQMGALRGRNFRKSERLIHHAS